ncbi:MAG: molybdate ABC transporter permease subunit [Granulosicoccus sp.]
MSAIYVSFKLALWTTLLLLPIGLFTGRWLASTNVRGKAWIESMIMLPLVLPPTVIGYYLLVIFSPQSVSGNTITQLLGHPLVFTFPGLVIASVIVNLPFAIQPVQVAFSNLSHELREAAWVSGLSPLKTWWHIELPLTWQGILASTTLVFAHTLGEFGVVLMVGGNIEGSTRTISIAIYDSVQSFDMKTAGLYSLALLAFSLLALAVVRYNPGLRRSNSMKALKGS